LASTKKLKFRTQDLIFKYTQNTRKSIIKGLAELILIDQVSMIITGLDPLEAKMSLPITKRLMIPTILINGNSSFIRQNKYAFQVFPQQNHLAKRIAMLIKKRKFKKIAIFRPMDKHSDILIDTLKKYISSPQLSDTEVVFDLKYYPGDFDSMESAVKQVSGIDYIKRKEEFELEYQQAKQKAEDEGIKFKANQVILPADLKADVVIIPDSFRMAHHFSNVFKYHGVSKIPFIGNHEWRAQGLVEPWEPFLQGSYFVDFIGDYKHLPEGISSLETDSSYFTMPAEAANLDFQLIGYRAGAIAIETTQSAPKYRKDLRLKLIKLRSKEGFYTESLIFDKRRSSYWPTYLFSINSKSLILLNSANYGSNYKWPNQNSFK
jgi:hypothetical protein